MEVSSSYGMNGLFGLDALNGVSADGKSRKSSKSSSVGGDTVDISDEAKKLFSEKIHQYDTQKTTVAANAGGNGQGVENSYVDADAADEGADGEGGSGGVGGSGGGSSSGGGNSVEDIKKKIESLKSQLMSMAGQISGGGSDAATTSKMNSLQSQIAALEAQLSEMQQAG